MRQRASALPGESCDHTKMDPSEEDRVSPAERQSANFLLELRTGFKDCCACPGCLSIPLTSTLFCCNCSRASAPCRATTEGIHKKAVTAYILSRPELAGTICYNVKSLNNPFLENQRDIKGCPWEECLWLSFEADCTSKGLKSPNGNKKWFRCGDIFSQTLRMSGLVVQDIHGDSFPDPWQAKFIDDFSTAVCSHHGCSRPAHVRSLLSASQPCVSQPLSVTLCRWLRAAGLTKEGT